MKNAWVCVYFMYFAFPHLSEDEQSMILEMIGRAVRYHEKRDAHAYQRTARLLVLFLNLKGGQQ